MSVDGLISGLDTTELIDSIMAVERRSVLLLEARKERYTNRVLSSQSVTAKLLSLQSGADALSRSTTFDARVSTSSDTDILTASAAARAAVGSYDLTVEATARAHQVASQGFADLDEITVGLGTLDLTVNGETTTVTISSAATLEGLRDAINLAGSDVRAAIINDGGATHPYRLLLTSANTGVENAISITNNLAGGTAPVFASNSITDPVADSGNVYSGTASAAGSYTGTSGITYTVEIMAGGDLGVATYRVSEDGGSTWGSTQTLAATIDVYDDLNGTNLGADMGFEAGTFSAGDTFTMRAFVPTVQQAQDALISMGSGAGKIEITSSSNRVVDAIPGVTLELKLADADTTVTLEVAEDTTAIKNRITNLISSFNAAVNYISENSGYNKETKVAGLFLGDGTMARLQSDLRSDLFSTITGTETYDSLFSLGLSISDTGNLSIDTSALTDALAENFDDVAKIFKTTGTSTNGKISFLVASSATVETTQGYDVDITQAATHGKITGTSIDDPAVTPLVIDSTNNELIVTVDGITSRIMQLTQKTYTSGTQLAREIQTQIDNDEYLTDKNVIVTFFDEGATGYIEIRSELYGANSSVTIDEPANSAAGVLGLTSATAVTGTHVAGTINGESATGSGQFLTGNDGNATTDGLMLRVSLDPDDLGAGAEASLTVVKGIGTQLAERLAMWTDSVDGVLKMREGNAQDQIDDLDVHIERMEGILAGKRQRLVEQFIVMEQALATMQRQGSYIGIQLAALMSRSQNE